MELMVAVEGNRSVNGLQLGFRVWLSRVKFGILAKVPAKVPGVQI